MVRSSSTCTSRLAGSPLGDASHAPSAEEVATTQNGEAESQATSRSVSACRALSRTRGVGVPTSAVRDSASVISVQLVLGIGVALMGGPYAGDLRVQPEIEAPRLTLGVAGHPGDLVEQSLDPSLDPLAVLGREPEPQARTVEQPGSEALDLLEER